MFTGLIQDVGQVESVETESAGWRLRIATDLGSEIQPGDSVAVNGVCLTATRSDDARFEAEIMKQTLSVTASAMLVEGDRVNLELAMKASDRFGGHIVQGHVDCVGQVIQAIADGFARRLRVRLGPSAMRYMIPQGSIAIDGVSLTISAVGDDFVEVSLIPETQQRTTLGETQEGQKLNVECDLIAKHVERLMSPLARKEPE